MPACALESLLAAFENWRVPGCSACDKRYFLCLVNLLIPTFVQVYKTHSGRNYMNKVKAWFIGGTALAAAAFAVPLLLHADGEEHGRSGRRPGAHRMFGGGE